MALPKEIKHLIALAAQGPGPVPQPRMRDQATHKKPINPQHPEAVAKAKDAAVAIFAWIDSSDGKEIRAEMKEQGAKVIPLHGWRVCMTLDDGVLHTRRESNPQMGPFDNTRLDVRTPEDLISAVGPEIVCSLHEDIVHGRLWNNMGAHLRQLTVAGSGAH